MKLPIIIALISIIANSITLSAQNHNIDSLKNLSRSLSLKPATYTNDTILTKTYNSLCREFIFIGAYDKADSIAKEALAFEDHKLSLYKTSQSAFFKRYKAISNNCLGIVQSCQGNQTTALDYFNLSLKINQEVGDKKGISSSLGSIGNAFKDQGNYSRALENYFGALKLTEELKLDNLSAIHLANIGNAYQALYEYQKSLDYYFKALHLAEKMDDKRGIAIDLGNIGMVYMHLKEYNKALEYYFKSLEMAESMDLKLHIVNILGNIGNMYEKKKEYPKALEFLQKALVKAQEISDKGGMARLKGSIGSIYVEQKKFKDAELFLKDALALAIEVGDLNTIKDQHQSLSKLYNLKNDWELAFKEYQLFISTRDSLFSQENTKNSLRSELNFEYEKKATADSVKHISERKIKDTEISLQQVQLKQEKTKGYALYGGLALVLVFSVFMVNRFRVTNKQKEIIELKEIETQKQKHIIEEKHKEITDSINYAERIQRSFLASDELLKENLNDYFVFFQPKDIVSGDFYWASKLKNGQFALTTADSTGHGVPGAIMSIINISCLEKAVEEQKLTEPSDILNHTRIKIIERLKKDGSAEGGKDGMDCSLICFDFKHKKLTYAAANNPVWIVRAEQLLEYESDKMPVGKHDKDTISFTQHSIDIQTGDVVYALTDGLPDQFGGPKGKKFMYKQLKDLLVSIAQLPMLEQQDILKTALNNWKGNLEQVDDVCVIGVRI